MKIIKEAAPKASIPRRSEKHCLGIFQGARIVIATGVLVLLTIACAGVSGEPQAGPSGGEPPAEGEAPSFEPTVAPPADSPGSQPTLPVVPTAEPAQPTIVPVFPEQRLITLEWPGGIRVGDSDIVRLRLEVDEAGQITPTAFFEDHQVQAELVEIESLYDTHVIRAEARLEILGLEISPPGTTDRRLLPGEPVEFSWTLRPEATGTYRGTVWLMVRYFPMDGGEEMEKTLFSRPLEINGQNLLGLGGQAARLLGLLGTGITSLFGLDDILTWIRRFRKRGAADD